MEGFDAEAWREEQRVAFEARLAGVRVELQGEGFADPADVLDVLFRRDCQCGCHPSIGSDSHEGRRCSCQQSPAERKAAWDEMSAELERWWASEEFQAQKAADAAALDEARAWADAHGMTAERRSIACPEQWTGTVDGVPFYFRERHGSWSIEAPSSFDERGPIVAEGAEGQYDDAVQLLAIIARSVRANVVRQHSTHLDAHAYCPDCGLAVEA